MSSISLAAWGKLPAFGDFLRLGSNSAPVSAFDAAFTALALDQQRAAAFAASGPVLTFIHHSDRWWGSVVLPSHDSVGRKSPFVATAAVRSIDPGDEIGVLPLAFAPFIQRILAQHQAGWPTSQDAVGAAVSAAAAGLDLEKAEGDFVARLEATAQADLWGAFGSAEACRQAMSVAAAAANGTIPGAGLRVLPVAGQIQACFWLAAIWMVRSRDEAPGPLVIHPGGPGLAPSVTVLWPSPTAGQLAAALWPGSCQPEQAVSVVTTGRTALPVGYELPAELFTDSRGHLRDLLYRLVTERRTRRYTRRIQ